MRCSGAPTTGAPRTKRCAGEAQRGREARRARVCRPCMLRLLIAVCLPCLQVEPAVELLAQLNRRAIEGASAGEQ